MSLDVYLTVEEKVSNNGTGIFVRENGQTKEITRAEWDEKFPDREPIVIKREESNQVFSWNITHNLNTMAEAADLYTHLWRPEEIGITKAGELIHRLKLGIQELTSKPDHYKTYNPDNGWGDYDGLVTFVEKYLQACIKYPDATISVSR